MTDLFGTPLSLSHRVADRLNARHYLGPSKRGQLVWETDEGVMVFANPASRHLPQQAWLELTRWCLNGQPNAGSRQWSGFVKWARRELRHITTVVSYSDPSVGHTGALYRACNWLWAPTWHRLTPFPSGNGTWGTDKVSSVKDRWIFPLQPDADRERLLRIKPGTQAAQTYPWAEYRERTGGDWKRWNALQHEREVAA